MLLGHVNRLLACSPGASSWVFHSFEYDTDEDRFRQCKSFFGEANQSTRARGVDSSMHCLSIKSCEDLSFEHRSVFACFEDENERIIVSEAIDGSFEPLMTFSVPRGTRRCWLCDGPVVWILCGTGPESSSTGGKNCRLSMSSGYRLYCASLHPDTGSWSVSWDSIPAGQDLRPFWCGRQSTDEIHLALVVGTDEKASFKTWVCHPSVGASSLHHRDGSLAIPHHYASVASVCWVDKMSQDITQQTVIVGTLEGNALEFVGGNLAKIIDLSPHPISSLHLTSPRSSSPLLMATYDSTNKTSNRRKRKKKPNPNLIGSAALFLYPSNADSSTDPLTLIPLKTYPVVQLPLFSMPLDASGVPCIVAYMQEIKDFMSWNGRQGVSVLRGGLEELVSIVREGENRSARKDNVVPQTYLSVYTSLSSQLARDSQTVEGLRRSVAEKKALIRNSLSILTEIIRTSPAPSDLCELTRATQEASDEEDSLGFVRLVGDPSSSTTPSAEIPDENYDIHQATEDASTREYKYGTRGLVGSRKKIWTPGYLGAEWRQTSVCQAPVDTQAPEPVVAVDKISGWYDPSDGVVRILASVRNMKTWGTGKVEDIHLEIWSQGVSMSVDSDICPSLTPHTCAHLQASFEIKSLRALPSVLSTESYRRWNLGLNIAVGFRNREGASVGRGKLWVGREFRWAVKERIPLFPIRGVLFSRSLSPSHNNVYLGWSKGFRHRESIGFGAGRERRRHLGELLAKKFGLRRFGGIELDRVLLQENMSSKLEISTQSQSEDRLVPLSSVSWWRERTEMGQTTLQIRVCHAEEGSHLLIYSDSMPRIESLVSSIYNLSSSPYQEIKLRRESVSARDLEIFLEMWLQETKQAIEFLGHFLEKASKSRNSKQEAGRGGIFRLFKGVRSVSVVREYCKAMTGTTGHMARVIETNEEALRVLFSQ